MEDDNFATEFINVCDGMKAFKSGIESVIFVNLKSPLGIRSSLHREPAGSNWMIHLLVFVIE